MSLKGFTPEKEPTTEANKYVYLSNYISIYTQNFNHDKGHVGLVPLWSWATTILNLYLTNETSASILMLRPRLLLTTQLNLAGFESTSHNERRAP